MTDLISREAAVAAHLTGRRIYDDIVHRLRSRRWSRLEAEGEALEMIEKLRANKSHDQPHNPESPRVIRLPAKTPATPQV